jgi:hypothetical protein
VCQEKEKEEGFLMVKVKHGKLGWAVFSDDEAYRYILARGDVNAKTVNWVLLNPSTATEDINDPTITRCIKYAERWGYGGVFITNIFALRSTDPKNLYNSTDPVGTFNDTYIRWCAGQSELIVAGWGSHGKLRGRGGEVARLLHNVRKRPKCLKMTKAGHPGHPLYLKANLRPQPWQGWYWRGMSEEV